MDQFSAAERSRVMAQVKSRDTSPEMSVRKVIHRLGYRYRLHVQSLPGTPDLVFPRLKCIIDVRGCFWHSHKCDAFRMPVSNHPYWEKKLGGNVLRDRRNLAYWKRLGYRVLVVWECQTHPRRLNRLTLRLQSFLDGAEATHGDSSCW